MGRFRNFRSRRTNYIVILFSAIFIAIFSFAGINMDEIMADFDFFQNYEIVKDMNLFENYEIYFDSSSDSDYGIDISSDTGEHK